MQPPGLYVHVPFCARACPYCDFDFEVGRGVRLAPRIELYFDTLAREFDARKIEGPVHTLYLGGGTPSALGAQGLRRLFAFLDTRVRRETCVEQTVELNPEHVDEPLLDALENCGVARVSLGVQSLHAPVLAELGRAHSVERALSAIRACSARFETSIDLIVGSPGMPGVASSMAARLEQLDLEILRLVELGVQHVSVYALTIEAGSSWPALVARGQRQDPDNDAQSEELLAAEAKLSAAGFHHYEVASYGRPGHEALHNSLYWGAQDYLGVGPSAHSARIEAGTVHRRANPRGLDAWASAGGKAAEQEVLDGIHAAAEALWLGLRRLDGMKIDTFLSAFPQVREGWVRERVQGQVRRGNLEWQEEDLPGEGPRLRVAPGRWLWHDSIGEALLEALEEPAMARSRDAR